MHFFFYIRGVYGQCELWKTLAQSQFFKWERTDKATGVKHMSVVQGALRQSVLGVYEYVFPEEALADVMSIFGLYGEEYVGVDGGVPTLNTKLKLGTLRVILGAQKIPKKIFKEAKDIPPTLYFNESNRAMSNLQVIHGVSIHPIGIKKDVRGEITDPLEKITWQQEML